jgi:hypothetical protein
MECAIWRQPLSLSMARRSGSLIRRTAGFALLSWPPGSQAVQKPLEREWDLTIDPDKVRQLVLKARALSAAVRDDYAAGQEHEVELDDNSRNAHHHDGLAEEEVGDHREMELKSLLNDLNVDETADLIALMWIGRGDYDVAEWTEAVTEARRYNVRRAATYLLGRPMLGDWLEEGLEAIGA